MQRVDAVRPPELSEREKEVLERLGRLQDKQIATELGLTGHGVRYHLRKLFAKLGAKTRAEALRRARIGGDRGFGLVEPVPTRHCGGGVSGGDVPGASASRAARAAGGAHRPEHPGRVCVYGSCL